MDQYNLMSLVQLFKYGTKQDEEINCNLFGFKPLQYESVLQLDFCYYSAQLHMLIWCSHMHPTSRSPTIHNPISFQHQSWQQRLNICS